MSVFSIVFVLECVNVFSIVFVLECAACLYVCVGGGSSTECGQ